MRTLILLVGLLALTLAPPALSAPPPGGAAAEEEKRPGLEGQTRTRTRKPLPKSATERSLLESIENQKQIIDLEDRNNPNYPLQWIALADFYWDLAEWYGLQINSEEIEKPLYAAEQRGDKAAIERLKAQQAALLEKKRGFQDKTIDVYRDVIRRFKASPKLDEMRYFLAYNLTEMGNADEGLQVYSELIGLHPSSPYVPDAIVNIGEHYFNINDFSNALRLYQQAEKFPEAGIYGYAIYKQGWCYYNLGDYKESLRRFIEVIELSNKQALAGAAGAIRLKQEAQNDMVLPYSKAGRAGDAIVFLKTYAPERYLELAGRLARIYTEQNEFQRSTKLLRDLIKEARSGNIAGQDKSYLVIAFQRQIVDNAMMPGDKAATVEEIGELLRVWQEISTQAPREFVMTERDEVKRLVLSVAAAYHKEYTETLEMKTLEYTQRLYDEYLRVFQDDENTYQIAMNNALLLLATEKWEEAAAAFERVIELQPDGEFADNAAERAVIAYLKVIAFSNAALKDEDLDDVKTKRDLTPEEQRFVHAIDRWMEIVAKKGPNPQTEENIPTARFAAAKVLYNSNRFDESATRFAGFLKAHPNHPLTNDARRHVLSAYNLAHDVDNLTLYANEFGREKDLPEELRTDIQGIKNALNYQQCFKSQERGAHVEAAECFKRYAAEFPASEQAPAAMDHAGANYFEARDVEKALRMYHELYATYRTKSDRAPKALYNIAEIFRRTTVYDEASKFYESFVQSYPKHPLSEKALRMAAIFRKTLGQHKQAVSNLELWLKRYGDPAIAPRVHLDIIKIFEREANHRAVVKEATRHLRAKDFQGEPPSVRLEVLNMRGLAQDALGKDREAHGDFQATVELFHSLEQHQIQDITVDAVSAVAESHFNLGEVKLREARRIKLDQKSRKAFNEALKQKLQLMNETKGIYEKVIGYGHPGWTIAASERLGLAFEDLADAVESTPVPREIQRLGPIAVDEFKQKASEEAQKIRVTAITNYKQALDVAKRERWFNEYSEKAEAAIARLDLADLSIKEYRLRPTHLHANSAFPSFITAQGVQ